MSKKKKKKAGNKSTPKIIQPKPKANADAIQPEATPAEGQGRPFMKAECPKEHALFVAKLRKELAPVGGLEEMYADEYIMECWRLARLSRFEDHLNALKKTANLDEDAWLAQFKMLTTLRKQVLRLRQRALDELEALQDERRRATMKNMTRQEYRMDCIRRNYIPRQQPVSPAVNSVTWMPPLEEEDAQPNNLPDPPDQDSGG